MQEKLTLYTASDTTDSRGGRTFTYDAGVETWGEVKNLNGRADFVDGRINKVRQVEMIIRSDSWSLGAVGTHKITWDSTDWRIHSYHSHKNNNRYTVILAYNEG